MKIVSGKLVMTLALLLVLLATSLPGCGGSAPSLPIKAQLSFSEPPILGKTVQLTATFNVRESYNRDAYNVTARIILPEGFEKIGGDLEWQGDFIRGNTYTLNATVKAVKTGDWKIEARADFSPGEGSYLGGSTVLYVSVSETGATVRSRPPDIGCRGPVPAIPIEPSQIPSPSSGGSAPSLPIEAQLSFSEPPILGKTVQLTATFNVRESYNRDAYNVTARIILPEGFEKIGGDLEWKGDFIRGNTYTLNATVKAVKTGDWKIEARADFSPREGSYLGGSAVLYVSVSETGATVSDRPLEKEGPTPIPIEPSQIPSPSPEGARQLETAQFEATLSNPLIVTGFFNCYISENSVPAPRVEREDELAPMVWGGIYVYNARTNAFLGSVCTGMGALAGEFGTIIENPYPDGFFIRAIPVITVAEVKTQLFQDYICEPPVIWYPEQPQQSIDIGSWTIDSENADLVAAWRIYETMANDYYNRGVYYFLKTSDRGPHYDMPVVTAIYPTDLPYTCYDPFLEQIHIKHESDTKALDVVQHEYGHRVYDEFLGNPALVIGEHYFGEESSPEVAWSEGWASFFSFVVQNEYVFEWGEGSQQDMEIPTWEYLDWENGDCVEGRVAGALWDIFDDDDDNWDECTEDFDEIWDTFSEPGEDYDTFAEFWDVLKEEFSNYIPPRNAIFQNTILYDIVQGDANEDGNVNALDITKVERIIVGLDPRTPGADATLDGKINALDITKVERIIAGFPLGAGISPPPAATADVVTVSVDAPAQVVASSDFTVNLNISQVTNLDAVNYDVTFDPAVIRLDNVTNGLIGSTTIPVDIYRQISPSTYTVVQNVSGLSGVTGSGTLAVLHFHVLGTAGQTSDITPSNGVLSDNLAQEIAATWTGDSVLVVANFGFLLKWGSYGTGDGQFRYPSGVAVDSSGSVYVADRSNNRIQKFNSSGAFITKWGSYGTGDGQFRYPSGVAVDSSGNVYVADEDNHRIQKFDSNGTFITKWGTSGTGDGQFRYPSGVAVDSSGNVYVADRDNHRIQKFDSNGTFITKWGTSGTGDGQFRYPTGVAVDSSGNVYVADEDNHRIQKFGPY